MKKFLMTVLSVCLALVLTVVSGCSCAGCNGATLLEFNNYFLGESVTGDATVGYTETLTYKVKSADNYKTTNLEKSSEIKDDVALYSYEGTYTVTLSVINAVSLPAEITTNIDLEGKTVYHLISDLQIASTYTVNGDYAEGYQNETTENGNVLYNDYVKSEVYFLGSGYSFAPIWSTTEQSYSYLLLGSKANVEVTKSKNTIAYNKGSYKIQKYENDEVVDSSNHGYDYRSLIDNAQLLFAIRNTDIKKDGSYSAPTVSSAFGSAKTILIKNKSETTETVVINGSSKSVPVKNLTYAVNSQYNTGASHHVLLQKSATNDLDFHSYVIEYAAPLVAYGSFASMGAMVYTLESIA